jgi:hypothetical protein
LANGAQRGAKRKSRAALLSESEDDAPAPPPAKAPTKAPAKPEKPAPPPAKPKEARLKKRAVVSDDEEEEEEADVAPRARMGGRSTGKGKGKARALAGSDDEPDALDDLMALDDGASLLVFDACHSHPRSPGRARGCRTPCDDAPGHGGRPLARGRRRRRDGRRRRRARPCPEADPEAAREEGRTHGTERAREAACG